MNDLVDLAKLRTETRYGGDWLDTILGPHPASGGQAPAELNEWVLVFGYHRNPIPMNGSRGSHYAHSSKVKGVRRTTFREAGYAGIPRLEHCRVQLTWFVLDARRRDTVNLSFTLKAMQDGLVEAGVVPDDTPDRMDTGKTLITRVDHRKHSQGWMELTVSRWDGVTP